MCVYCEIHIKENIKRNSILNDIPGTLVID